MFQMTPEYPGWMTRGLGWLLFAGLVLWTLAMAWPAAALFGNLATVLLLFGNAAFALATLDLQRRRKRRLPDVTLDFWRVAMGCLLVTLLLFVVGLASPAWSSGVHAPLLLGAGLAFGFALSAVNGMLYKIVPFLVWFHLQNRLLHSGLLGSGAKVPHMKQVLPDRLGRRQLRAHVVALMLLPAALLWPMPWLYPFALVLGASFTLLGLNLWNAALLYRREARRLAAVPA